jgi:hypothetical protein
MKSEFSMSSNFFYTIPRVYGLAKTLKWSTVTCRNWPGINYRLKEKIKEGKTEERKINMK